MGVGIPVVGNKAEEEVKWLFLSVETLDDKLA